MRRNLFDGGLTVNGDKKLAVFGIAAACVIGLINHMQYRNLAKRMEDLEVTVEMELFPDLAFPRIHTRKVREEEEPDWWEEDLASSCEAGSTEGSCPAFKGFSATATISRAVIRTISFIESCGYYVLLHSSRMLTLVW